MLIRFDAGAILLLDEAGGLRLSWENPFDFHAEIWLLVAIFENIYRLDEQLNKFCAIIFKIRISSSDTRNFVYSIFVTTNTICFHCFYIVYSTTFTGLLFSSFISLYSINTLLSKKICHD